MDEGLVTSIIIHMVLLEISPPAPPPFLCSLSVKLTVRAAVEHVAKLHRLRSRLSEAVAETSGSRGAAVGSKRARDAAALADAEALLSPQGVSRKTVLTSEALEAALAPLLGTESVDDAAVAMESNGGLFFAGKWLDGDKLLSEYVGTNEKSKVKVVFGNPAADEDGVEAAAAAPSSAPSAAAEAPAATTTADKKPVDGTAAAGVSLSAFFKQQGGSGGGGSSNGWHEADGNGAAAEEPEDEDLPQLSARQAQMLVESSEIRSALKDPRLQEHLRFIDSAPTREGALKRLERALGADADFDAFTRTALKEIGAVEPSAE